MISPVSLISISEISLLENKNEDSGKSFVRSFYLIKAISMKYSLIYNLKIIIMIFDSRVAALCPVSRVQKMIKSRILYLSQFCSYLF